MSHRKSGLNAILALLALSFSSLTATAANTTATLDIHEYAGVKVIKGILGGSKTEPVHKKIATFRFEFDDDHAKDAIWVTQSEGMTWDLVHRGPIDRIYVGNDKTVANGDSFYPQLPRDRQNILSRESRSFKHDGGLFVKSGDHLVLGGLHDTMVLPWAGHDFRVKILDHWKNESGQNVRIVSLAGSTGRGTWALLSAEPRQAEGANHQPQRSWSTNYGQALALTPTAGQDSFKAQLTETQLILPTLNRTIELANWADESTHPGQPDVYFLWLEAQGKLGLTQANAAKHAKITPELITTLTSIYNANGAEGLKSVAATGIATAQTAPARTAVAPTTKKSAPPTSAPLKAGQLATESAALLQNPDLAKLKATEESGAELSLADYIRKNFQVIDRVSESLPEELAYFHSELEQASVGLSLRRGGSVRVTGRPGTGKSHFNEVLLSYIHGNEAPEGLKDRLYIRLRASDLASNKGVIGPYEQKVKALRELSQHVPITLVIDEIHTLKGQGSHSGKPSDFLTDILVELQNGQIKLIGTTTDKEWEQYYGKSQPLNERIQTNVKIQEPTHEKLLEIMRTFYEREYAHVGITVSNEILDFTAKLATKFNPIGANPRKSLSLLDYALAYGQHRKISALTKDEVVEYASALYGYKIADLAPARIQERVSSLRAYVDEKMQGAVEAKEVLIESLEGYLYKGFKKTSGRPFVAILSGRAGVGKTTLSKVSAAGLGYRSDLIAMNNYGSQHDIEAFKTDLAMKIRMNPYAVILLDEIEKADLKVQQALLQIFDEGRFEATLSKVGGDNSLVDIDASKIIFMVTTNAGEHLAERPHTRADFDLAAKHANVDPYLINRVDVYVPVAPPTYDGTRSILEAKLEAMRQEFLSEYGRTVAIDGAMVDGLLKSHAKNSKLTGDTDDHAHTSIRALEREIQQLDTKLSAFFMRNPTVQSATASLVSDKWVVTAVQSKPLAPQCRAIFGLH